MKTTRHPRGFVVLMSVIIISAILLLYVFGLGASGFFARFDALDSEHKRISLSLAESCVNAALLKIAQDSAYAPAAGGDTVLVGGRTCKICPGTNSPSGQATEPIVTRAVHNGAFTNLRVTVAVANGLYTVSGWSEEVNGDPACTLP